MIQSSYQGWGVNLFFFKGDNKDLEYFQSGFCKKNS